MLASYGLYVLSEDYFAKYGTKYTMDNKHGARPYYFAVAAQNGILWLVPLSSKVEKFRLSIEADEKRHGKGSCIFHYIAKVKGKESAFLIGDVIPATEKYIDHAFTVGGVPFIIGDKADIKAIQSKLSRFLTLVRRGKLKPFVDILAIERALLEEDEP